MDDELLAMTNMCTIVSVRQKVLQRGTNEFYNKVLFFPEGFSQMGSWPSNKIICQTVE